MPRYHSDLTLHYPFGVLYKEPLGYIVKEDLKSNETIVHCCHILHILESTSLCPFGALCVLNKISFACDISIERWRIEVVEAQVEDSISPVRRCVIEISQCAYHVHVTYFQSPFAFMLLFEGS